MNEETREIGDIQDLEGRYADVFRIGHSAFKFVLEFGQVALGQEATQFHTRVIMAPDNARDFVEMLGQSIRQYEGKFGPINADE